MTTESSSRVRARWWVAGGAAVLVMLAAGYVYSLSCDTENSEILELEIQSVERGGETVDDLSAWKQSDGEEITTTLVSQAGERERFQTRTESEGKSLRLIRQEE